MEEVGQRDGGEGGERLRAVQRVVNPLGPPPALQDCLAAVGSESGVASHPRPTCLASRALPSLSSTSPALCRVQSWVPGPPRSRAKALGQGCFCWASAVEQVSAPPPLPLTPRRGGWPDLLLTTSLVVLGAVGWAGGSPPNSLPFQKAPLADVGVEGTNISSSSRKRPEWVCRVSAVGGGQPQWWAGPGHPPVFLLGFQDCFAPHLPHLHCQPSLVRSWLRLNCPNMWVDVKGGGILPLAAFLPECLPPSLQFRPACLMGPDGYSLKCMCTQPTSGRDLKCPWRHSASLDTDTAPLHPRPSGEWLLSTSLPLFFSPVTTTAPSFWAEGLGDPDCPRGQGTAPGPGSGDLREYQ